MLRKLASSSFALIPVVSAASTVADPKPSDDQSKTAKKHKPQDLPIYSTIHDDEPKRYVFHFRAAMFHFETFRLSWFSAFLANFTRWIKCNSRAAAVQSEPSVVRSSIEGGVRVVRETCCDCVNSIKDKKKPVDEFVSTGIAHSQCKYCGINWNWEERNVEGRSKRDTKQSSFYFEPFLRNKRQFNANWEETQHEFFPQFFTNCSLPNPIVALDFLNEPTNGIHRAGAIGVGAVAGYILAIRRGFFRRLVYTSAGGLGVASICYPTEAEKYWHEAISQSKVYATILYNFAYGG